MPAVAFTSNAIPPPSASAVQFVMFVPSKLIIEFDSPYAAPPLTVAVQTSTTDCDTRTYAASITAIPPPDLALQFRIVVSCNFSEVLSASAMQPPAPYFAVLPSSLLPSMCATYVKSSVWSASNAHDVSTLTGFSSPAVGVVTA